jgi:hypothetical protein
MSVHLLGDLILVTVCQLKHGGKNNQVRIFGIYTVSVRELMLLKVDLANGLLFGVEANGGKPETFLQKLGKAKPLA